MTWSDTEPSVRQTIQEILEGMTPTVGRVWNRERYSVSAYRYPNEDEDNIVKGWAIDDGDANGTSVEHRVRISTTSILAFRTYTLRGFWSINDEAGSNVEMRQECTRVIHAIMEDRWHTPGIDLQANSAFPIVMTMTDVVFEGELVRMAEIEVYTQAEEIVDTWLTDNP